MAKKRVKSFEVNKAHGGYKVRVEHHPKKESGKGMHGAIGHYEPPEEHVHTNPAHLHKHIKELVSSMSVSPEGDGDSDDAAPNQTSALNE
jgi:hypothetical protein